MMASMRACRGRIHGTAVTPSAIAAEQERAIGARGRIDRRARRGRVEARRCVRRTAPGGAPPIGRWQSVHARHPGEELPCGDFPGLWPAGLYRSRDFLYP
jgi:hypothetical protein